MIITCQGGPQEKFLSTPADLCIFGGGAGGGKTYALLLEFLRHIENPNFVAIIFRRNSVQIRNPGGLWDTSMKMFAPLGAHPRQAYLEWKFPSGATLKMAHLENVDTVLSYQGAQIPLIMWDELTHFEESQVTYMMSRLRSSSGVPGYMRCTTNPDSESWVKNLISWYLDDDGFPIQARSGMLRWFIRRDDRYIWGDTRQELLDQYGQDEMPKSLTFIPSLVTDNKILMKSDPTYMSNLRALSRVDRMRLLDGNWKVKATGGLIFKREWFPIIDTIPGGWIQSVRFWDRAATKPNGLNDPDWTRGLKMFKYADGTFVIADLKSMRDTPGQVENLIKNVAGHDGPSVRIMAQRDPGSAGVSEADHFVRMLVGYDVRTETFSKDKLTRAKAVSAQAEVGNIRVLRAPWNDEFFSELENFPDGKHDDIVDVTSGAFNSMCQGLSLADAMWNSY